ncbi:hypothetical protein [Aquibium sp. ELW1220]|uniref:hypothetical protein n=1 Tax=Aquibium sp. ELW1220 TaxID=2976766 RepID=UPI0025AF2E11|nr:hypothetical protein [Aquibium sp. ELW1220]MDN2584303.1 hypothetical protein [Aquibium sp. ELW1220]
MTASGQNVLGHAIATERTRPLVPRFHFHLKSNRLLNGDDVGKELANASLALVHARKLVAKIIQYTDGAYEDGLRMVVTELPDPMEGSTFQLIVPFPRPDHIDGEAFGQK